jgi:hypothetical protein
MARMVCACSMGMAQTRFPQVTAMKRMPKKPLAPEILQEDTGPAASPETAPAAARPVRKAAGKAAKTPAKKSAPSRPAKPAPTPAKAATVRLDPVLRRALVAQCAYFRAEKRGFSPGGEAQDWLEAEAEVARILGEI